MKNMALKAMNHYRITSIAPEDEALVWAFLDAHAETSVLLAGALKDYGPTIISGKPRSANFKCIKSGNQLHAVFSVNSTGELMLQTDYGADYANIIVEALQGESMKVVCCEADWALAEGVWRELQLKFTDLETSVYSKEILYALKLVPSVKSDANNSIRFLEAKDFEHYEVLEREYFHEQKLPLNGTREERRQIFEDKALRQCWWGVFDEGKLIAMAVLDGMTHRAAQIRGVHVRPEYRRRGHGLRLIKRVIADALYLHHLELLVLFTEYGNTYARRIYEKIGFIERGSFGLIYGTYVETPQTIA